ncbi:MAG: DNA adenine methylase [Clostridia bacterium]|nr:DNA adenine methylase [Clostridia bacterium]
MLNNENPQFLTDQLVTYLGNKRALVGFIGQTLDIVKAELSKEKLNICDIFTGSGATARFFKAHSDKLIVNDLENYVEMLNKCYLTNKEDVPFERLENEMAKLKAHLAEGLHSGFISQLYAPKNDEDIKKGERVFFTTRNANYIDTARQYIENMDESIRHFFIAPLIFEASVKNNTSGVFKGFYKNSRTGVGQFGGNGRNALSRILADIDIPMPIFSEYSCNVEIHKADANILAENLPTVDLMYLDPPYNQHPYGSNYFMLNLICDYKKPQAVSRVSGIPTDWNRSDYNREKAAHDTLFDLCMKAKAKYLLISFNSEGFISKGEMEKMLSQIGEVRTFQQRYNAYKASRNLYGRDVHINEYLYLIKKY